MVAPEICYGGTPGDKTAGPGTVELMEEHWAGRYRQIKKEWFERFARRSVWDSTKTESVLGWDHDRADEQGWA